MATALLMRTQAGLRIVGRTLVGLMLAVLLAAAPALAVQPDEILDDPKLETRARALSAELRCLVCQNQSIDESDAPLARDLRLLVRERLVAGDSDTEVMDYVVARYGEFVLLRPPVGLHTALLWGLPPLLLVLASLFIWSRTRRSVGAAPVADDNAPGQPLSDDERDRLARLMGDQKPDA